MKILFAIWMVIYFGIVYSYVNTYIRASSISFYLYTVLNHISIYWDISGLKPVVVPLVMSDKRRHLLLEPLQVLLQLIVYEVSRSFRLKGG